MDETVPQLRALLESERAARLEAERASRLKDEFLEALGHELRAPLNAILGWSRLMELGRLGSQETQSGGQTIARNARLVAHVLDDLLDLSAVTSGRIRVDPEETDLSEIVQAALEILHSAASSKGVKLEKHLIPSCLVFGDPHRLQQVVWHLLSNAIKFTPRGGHARVSLRVVGGQCEIVVADTGAGIASELLPFVFDRYWRAEASPEHRYAGLGLGLALAKELVELHGGTVIATSAGLNRGATFTVTLPRVAPRNGEESEDAPLRLTREAHARSDANSPYDASLTGLRVLVVDDEPDTLDLLRRVLGDSQAQVAAAASVEAALATLGGFDPHVLISDVSMPGRDGYELIRAVRSTTGPEDLPAAALTAYSRPEDADRARQAGFQVYLSKPIEPDELVKVVAHLAGRG